MGVMFNDLNGIHRFPRPILHGLCTLGYATRAIISSFCGGDPTMVQSMQGRFLVHVFPGETLVTEMWRDDSQTRYLSSLFFQLRSESLDQFNSPNLVLQQSFSYDKHTAAL